MRRRSPLDEQLGALEDLRAEGKLDLIGVSTQRSSEDDAERAMDSWTSARCRTPTASSTATTSRSWSCVGERGIAYVPFFPLGSAFTGGPRRLAEDPAIAAVARRHEATPSQVALAWLLAVSPRTLLIPGTASVAHLEENMAAGDMELDAEDLAELERVQQVGDPLATAE